MHLCICSKAGLQVCNLCVACCNRFCKVLVRIKVLDQVKTRKGILLSWTASVQNAVVDRLIRCSNCSRKDGESVTVFWNFTKETVSFYFRIDMILFLQTTKTKVGPGNGWKMYAPAGHQPSANKKESKFWFQAADVCTFEAAGLEAVIDGEFQFGEVNVDLFELQRRHAGLRARLLQVRHAVVPGLLKPAVRTPAATSSPWEHLNGWSWVLWAEDRMWEIIFLQVSWVCVHFSFKDRSTQTHMCCSSRVPLWNSVFRTSSAIDSPVETIVTSSGNDRKSFVFSFV